MLTRDRDNPQNCYNGYERIAAEFRCDGGLVLVGRSSPFAAVGGYGSAMPLRYVDPPRKRRPGYRVAESFGRTPAGQWFARNVSTRLDPLLYRAAGGRFTTPMVVNAPLVTIGAKSGADRKGLG